MSLWSNYKDTIDFPTLTNDKEVDVLIIGGGLAGLSTMYALKEQKNICLLERNKIGSSITENTTGKLTFLQETIYTDLINKKNKETAIQYLNSQKEAIQDIKEIIETEKIVCDLEKVDSYIFTENEMEIEKIKDEKKFLEEQKIKVIENNPVFSVPHKYAISVEDTYVFNPMKFINALTKILKDKEIYENTKVTNIEYKNGIYICSTENSKIVAKKVIIACHYPFFTIPFLLPLKSYIEKSYILACKTKKNEKYACITIDKPTVSLRYYNDGKDTYKICLSASHNAGIKQDDKKNFSYVQKIFEIKEEEIVAKWSNVDIMTDDQLPFIGELKKNLYIMTGFNTWGMTNSVIASKIIADKIKNKNNPFENLFSLQRNSIWNPKNMLPTLASNVMTFIKSKKINKKWYTTNLQFCKKDGKKIAIYTDKKGISHMVYTTCPHLGCGLLFNEEEQTWDCPCHSSRFSIDGKCIKGPSLYDISYKK